MGDPTLTKDRQDRIAKQLAIAMYYTVRPTVKEMLLAIMAELASPECCGSEFQQAFNREFMAVDYHLDTDLP